MFPLKVLQAYLLRLGLTAVAAAATLLGVSATPAAAEIKIIGGADFYGGSQSPSVGGFIYGSPIPTPIPVNPATGFAPNPAHNSYPHRVYHSYPEYDYYSYPDDDYYDRRGRYYDRDTILVNPVLVNPSVKNSTLVNPTIIDSYGRKPVRNHIIIKSW